MRKKGLNYQNVNIIFKVKGDAILASPFVFDFCYEFESAKLSSSGQTHRNVQ